MYKSIGRIDDAFRTKQVFEALRRAQSSSEWNFKSQRIFIVWSNFELKVNQKCHRFRVNTACRVSTASTRTSTMPRSWQSRRNIAWEKSSSRSWRCCCTKARRPTSISASPSTATTSPPRSVITTRMRHLRREFSTRSETPPTIPLFMFTARKSNWCRSIAIRLSCRFISLAPMLELSSGRPSTTEASKSTPTINCRSFIWIDSIAGFRLKLV